MALSGTLYSGNFGSNSFRLKLVWSATQNVSNNTSTISATLYFESLQSWAKFNDATNSAWNINIDGANYTGTANSTIAGNQSKKIGSASRTISHNSDGSKSFSISGGHTIDISYSGSTIGSQSVSGSGSLNSIARASSVSATRATADMGAYNGIFIKIARASSSFTHDLKYSFGSKSGSIGSKITWTDHEWTIPADLATETPNSTSGWGTIICDTYNGSTKIGTSTTKFYANVPNNANYNPTISVPTLTDTNAAVNSAVGSTIIQGMSNIKITSTGGTKYGASISSVVFKVKVSNHNASISGSTATATSSPTDSGVHAVVATITDSRGRTATSSTSFTVTAYKPPSISSFSAFRKGLSEAVITANGVGTMTAIGTSNTATLKIFTSLKGANNWAVVKTLTSSNGSGLSTGAFDIGGMLITSAYDVKLEIYDKLRTTPSVQIISVGTAIFPMSWGKTGIGVGTIFNPNGAALQVIGGIQADRYVATIMPAGSNFNNYTDEGWYYQPASANAATMLNRPTDVAFSLFVERHAGVKQTVTEYRDTYVKIFVRNMYNGYWGAWEVNHGEPPMFPIARENGWGIYGGSYLFPHYWRTSGGMVHLGGMLDGGSRTAGVRLGTLPSGYRPDRREIFNVHAWDKTYTRIDITPEGYILVMDSPKGYISLSGISFMAKRM